MTWQNVELFETGPLAKVTIGYIMNQSALNMSLWISNMIILLHISRYMEVQVIPTLTHA